MVKWIIHYFSNTKTQDAEDSIRAEVHEQKKQSKNSEY